jgi:lysophospholipase L1-like esterase
MKRWVILFLVFVALTSSRAAAAEVGLKPGDAVAINGDSITEQKLYSVFIEDYLLMCQPAANLRTCQFGWGGETSWGFLARMKNDVIWFKPTVATTCYGMNDGGYSPMSPEKAKHYRDSQKAIVEQFKKAGVRLIIVGSPGCVDADTFHKKPADAAMYNKTLAGLRDIAKEVAQEEGVVFANVFDPMIDAMTKAKAKYGNNYPLAGGDGVHPGPNGHLVMAYAYLKAMGCTGDIGTITIDMGSGKAEATDGHKVVSSDGGSAEIESTRYPFCFFGNPEGQSTRSVIDFLPFNDELNRFKLVVKGAKADKLKVTWGTASKEFSKADLEKGINLAAEFIQNPFSEPFAKAEQAIKMQQNYETPLHKDLLHNMGRFREMVADESEAFDRIVAAAGKRQKTLSDASGAAVGAVKHTIKVEAAQ